MFSTIMKECQLKKAVIPATAILVDETQDMDQCQLSWLVGQLSIPGSEERAPAQMYMYVGLL